MSDMNQNDDKTSVVPGVAVFGCLLVGFAGLIGAAAAMFDFNDPTGAGACLAASAIAFGLAANASLRK
ncbi:MAG: hypothetical protein QGG42_15230 [Phycisphaerae bacterium]|nr:hypothetical protein [Phycisphaerae bacterium]